MYKTPIGNKMLTQNRDLRGKLRQTNEGNP